MDIVLLINFLDLKNCQSSGHMTLIDAASRRCIDLDLTLHILHVPAAELVPFKMIIDFSELKKKKNIAWRVKYCHEQTRDWVLLKPHSAHRVGLEILIRQSYLFTIYNCKSF